MTDETKDKIIDDAVEMGFLIEVCSSCGESLTSEGAAFEGEKYRDCGCSAGSSLRWNRRVMDWWEAAKLSENKTDEKVS